VRRKAGPHETRQESRFSLESSMSPAHNDGLRLDRLEIGCYWTGLKPESTRISYLVEQVRISLTLRGNLTDSHDAPERTESQFINHSASP